MRILLVIGLLWFFAFAWWLVRSGPHVEVNKVAYPPLTIRFETSNINGFLGVDFYSETNKEYLWSFSIENRPINEISYGVLPAKSEQFVPKAGRPRPLKVGDKILVCVNYQYDTFAAASARSKTWGFMVEGENKVKLLGDFSHIQLPPVVQVAIEKAEFPPLKLSIKNSNITGLRSVCFYSDTTKNYVWNIDVETIPLEEITYGVVPPKSKQIIPAEGPPRQLKVNEKIFVEIRYKYDSHVFRLDDTVANIWGVEIESETKVKLLGELSNVTLPPKK